MRYTSLSNFEKEHMLKTIGVATIDDLFEDIPISERITGLKLPSSLSEMELHAHMSALAAKNTSQDDEVSFLGGGSYDNYVPAVCEAIISRSEYMTAYTPYQPEISQGTLQAIFEFQTAISEITGLPVANASLYDGATAAAEAMYLAEQMTGKTHCLIVGEINPEIRKVLTTYAKSYGIKLANPHHASGTHTAKSLREIHAFHDELACVIVQNPNYYGLLETEMAEIFAEAKKVGALSICHTDPTLLGILQSPGELGADIVVGDGASLGNHPSFGGPSFGFMSVTQQLLRRIPGRIVGQSVDADDNRAYTLTLQTREQHIRREKATSSICTNQALNALAGIVYLSWLGPQGLFELGNRILANTKLLHAVMLKKCQLLPAFEGYHVKEIAYELPVAAQDVIAHCRKHGYNPGLALDKNILLIAVTEKRTPQQIEHLAQLIAEAISCAKPGQNKEVAQHV